jgi:hypothetical protein
MESFELASTDKLRSPGLIRIFKCRSLSAAERAVTPPERSSGSADWATNIGGATINSFEDEKQ